MVRVTFRDINLYNLNHLKPERGGMLHNVDVLAIALILGVYKRL